MAFLLLVNIGRTGEPALLLKSVAIFTEAAYTQTEHALRQMFLQRGRAWVEIQRRAAVNLNTLQARVAYTIQPGPYTTFGKTENRQVCIPSFGAGETWGKPAKPAYQWRQRGLWALPDEGPARLCGSGSD